MLEMAAELGSREVALIILRYSTTLCEAYRAALEVTHKREMYEKDITTDCYVFDGDHCVVSRCRTEKEEGGSGAEWRWCQGYGAHWSAESD